LDDIKVRTDFPRRVREIENEWITLKDGTRLAARIWLPEDAGDNPVPAILEYLPYRKRDGTVARDALTHPYFAGHGYASVRVDMRGTGDSEGVCRGEYLAQEQDDALEVLDWIAAQPWCTGRVGMIGISWGGFNGLQIAARQHPALQAVVSLCSTDDRYSDDIHFMGGCVLTDKLGWGATAFAIAMTPPDPAIVGGDRWRGMWKQRLENNGLWLLDWFRHQRRDDFYKHGSVCEDWSRLTTPVYAVGGWADGYTNAIFRMMEHLPGPKKALIGPWAHKYPHFARPGPRIGFLQECLRWWDHWLKDCDTGIMDEPMVRAWIEDPAPPAPDRDIAPGRWVAEPSWPAPGVSARALALSPGRLGDGGAEGGGEAVLHSPQTAGFTAGAWCVYGVIPDQSLDQREEAGYGLVFDTAPLDQEVEILGFPMLELRVASNRSVAMVAATLSEVASDGAATRISYGLLNLTHRDSHQHPEPLEPGRGYDVSVQLNACGHRFARGSRLRLTLSSAYWPIAFPSPEDATLTLDLGRSRLLLPVRPPQLADERLAPFPPAESAEPLRQTVLREGSYSRTLGRDAIDGTWVQEHADDSGRVRHEHTGIEFEAASTDTFAIRPDDPNSAEARAVWTKAYARGDWDARVETEVSVRALHDAWHIRARLRALDNGQTFHQQEWDEKIPRDFV
jgi:putative CocE/NonD family hydrolase